MAGGRLIVMRDLAQSQLDSVLGRTSPVLKLSIAIVWLLGLATTVSPWPPLVIGVLAIAAGITLGRIPGRDLARALAPLWLAALGLATFNALFGAANADQSAAAIGQVGPFRVTSAALAAGIGLGIRVAAIGATGAVFALTTDSTRLADSLVQQGRLPERFAYGALAAYSAVPRFSEDLTTLRQARRIRGLRGGWHPRLLVSLLVLAIRHGDRMAIAMDARGFGSGPRSQYREIRWGWLDLGVAAGAAAALVAALIGGARLSP
jgi:energy-coupling factor transport system permease protein